MKFKDYINEKTNSIVKVKRKKIDAGKYEIYAGDIKIADYTQRKDLVKARSTDRIRTKLGTTKYLSWNQTGLSKLFNIKVAASSASGWSNADFYHTSVGSSTTTSAIAQKLNDFAESKDIQLKFIE